MRSHLRVVAISLPMLAGGTALGGPDWVEGDDAGSNLGGAQLTLGSGTISTITGSLGGGLRSLDMEDMYLVRVLDPDSFSMTLNGALFDAQLFVFNVTLPGEAFGLLANDNSGTGTIPLVTQFSNDGSDAAIKYPGVYAIAISGVGRTPTSLNGSIFTFASATEISGPDGPGGLNPHTGWAGIGQTGDYQISLTGTGFYDLPAPGSSVVLMTAGVAAMRRRRR